MRPHISFLLFLVLLLVQHVDYTAYSQNILVGIRGEYNVEVGRPYEYCGIVMTEYGGETSSFYADDFDWDVYQVINGKLNGVKYTFSSKNDHNYRYCNVTFEQAGEYLVQYWITIDNFSYEVSFSVYAGSVEPLPVIEVSPSAVISDTMPVSLRVTSSSYASYEWFSVDGYGKATLIPGETQRVLTTNKAGRYYARVKSNSGKFYNSQTQLVAKQSKAGTRNYMLEYDVKTPSISSILSVERLSKGTCDKSIHYFDGLGRISQTVIRGGSPTGNLVQVHRYDSQGRESRNYLPYSTVSEDFDLYGIDALGGYDFSRQSLFYKEVLDIEDGSYAYSDIVFENSPLGRELEIGAPGSAWQPKGNSGHTIKKEYEINNNNDFILSFYVWEDKLLNRGYFDKGELYKTIVKNENWTQTSGKLHTTEEYKDKRGQVVLKRNYVMTGSTVVPVETYYVYDDFGLLRFVLPPNAVKAYQLGATALTDSKIITGNEILNSTPPVNNYIIATGGSLTLKSGFSFKASSTKSFTASTIDGAGDLIYAYKYDGLKRMIEKKIPGAAVVYMVYDLRDRLVATQDGEQRKTNQWHFTKYDALNRPILTGLWQDASAKTRDALQTFVNTYNDASSSRKLYEARGSIVHGYTNQSFPSVSGANSYLTVTYYDDYAWYGTPTVIDNYFNSLKNQFSSHGLTGATVPVINKFDRVKGQITGTKEKVLDNTNIWLASIVFYDDRYRPILTRSYNYVGGEDIVLNHYDFPGKLMESWHCHTTNLASPGKRIVRHKYDYDHAGRLLTTKQQMTGATQLVTIAANSYNELGQLKTKKVGNAVQQMDYQYNIRGWLTQINDPEVTPTAAKKLSLRLRYTDPIASLAAQAQYNGNISAIEWRTSESTGGSPNTKQGYGFEYDALNRLTTSVYGDGASLTSNKNRFNESITGYDLNGNIQGLLRRLNNQEIDRLIYSYDTGGNQMTRVTDSAPAATRAQGFIDGNTTGSDYIYDLNGNMTQDKNKGITQITYNHLNLPQKILGGSQTIEYIYSAGGQKLQKKAPNNEKTHYAGSFIYEGNSLKQVLHGEGYIDMSGTATYHYYLKDHLGNNRMVVNQSGTVVQQTDYYPFGMTFNKSGSSDNKYLYNGKELQEDQIGNGVLDWYDYGARMYDAALGRWHSVDPSAENYRDWTPYNYCANNPIMLVDLDGKDWFYYSTDGKKDPTWNWHDGSEYNTGVKNSNGEDIILRGREAVVVFNGSLDEKLGTKKVGDKGYDGTHTEGYIDGEGAVTANVTVYGPGGADDIQTYTGYTMSSDPSKYGIVNDGIYDANYDAIGKSGSLESHWTLNARGRVSTYWTNPYRSNQKDNNGNYYLTGIFIHRSNSSGWAGGPVSKGCLLIAPTDWESFNNQLSGVQYFGVQVTRTRHLVYKPAQVNTTDKKINESWNIKYLNN